MKVSVYLPTRNRADRVLRAAQSVLRQQFADLELIVVDDGSIDATPAALAGLAASDSRVRLLRHATSRGAPAARNEAIRAARGEFITGLDDDDLMLPDRLSSLLSAWRDHLSFVCSGWWLAGDGWMRPVHARAGAITADELLRGNVAGNQVLTTTARLREAGMFDETFAASQDHDLWTRLALRYGDGWRVAEPSLIVATGDGGPRVSDPGNALRGVQQFMHKHAASLGDSQRLSLELLCLHHAGRLPDLHELARFWSPATRRSLGVLLLRRLLPGSARLERWWWRRRWPIERGPRA